MNTRTVQLIEFDLGPGATEFVRSRLECGHALAQALMAHLPDFTGRASTFVPSGVDAASLTDFMAGGKLPRAPAMRVEGTLIAPVRNAYYVLSRLIERYAAAGPERAAIIENANARKGDPSLVTRRSRLAYSGDTVLHVISHGVAGDGVEAAVREAKSVPTFVGALGESPQAGWGLEISEAQLDEFARSVSAMFVGAYDGESFVLLRRRA